MHFFYSGEGSQLGAFGATSTWILIVVMGLLFTLGAFAFVRAFDDEPHPPLCKIRHFNTDELLGAWLTFFACLPAILYAIIFLAADNKNIFYWGAFLGSVLCALGALAFVGACYAVAYPFSITLIDSVFRAISTPWGSLMSGRSSGFSWETSPISSFISRTTGWPPAGSSFTAPSPGWWALSSTYSYRPRKGKTSSTQHP